MVLSGAHSRNASRSTFDDLAFIPKIDAAVERHRITAHTDADVTCIANGALQSTEDGRSDLLASQGSDAEQIYDPTYAR